MPNPKTAVQMPEVVACRMHAATTVLFLFLCFIPLGVSAQEITGSILGTVNDPTGAVVPGATITILNTDKNVLIRSVTSDATGEYVAPLLPIGNHSLTIEALRYEYQDERGHRA